MEEIKNYCNCQQLKVATLKQRLALTLCKCPPQPVNNQHSPQKTVTFHLVHLFALALIETVHNLHIPLRKKAHLLKSKKQLNRYEKDAGSALHRAERCCQREWYLVTNLTCVTLKALLSMLRKFMSQWGVLKMNGVLTMITWARYRLKLRTHREHSLLSGSLMCTESSASCLRHSTSRWASSTDTCPCVKSRKLSYIC
jgi:hypothetical protein